MALIHDSFKKIRIHTAKCDNCNGKRGRGKVYRCNICSRQLCKPCRQEKGGDATHYMPDRIYEGPIAPSAASEPQTPSRTTSPLPSRRPRRQRGVVVVEESEEEDAARSEAPRTRSKSTHTREHSEEGQGIACIEPPRKRKREVHTRGSSEEDRESARAASPHKRRESTHRTRHVTSCREVNEATTEGRSNPNEHQFNVEELAKTLLDQADRKTASTNDRSMGVEPLAVNNNADNFSPAPPAMSSDEHGLSVLYAAVVRVKATDEADAVEESNAANDLDKPRHAHLARSFAPHVSTAADGDGGNGQHEESLFISEYADLEREPLANTESAQGEAVDGKFEQEEIARDVPEQEVTAAGVFGQSEMTDEDYMPEQERVMNGEDEQEGIESEDEMSQTVQVLRGLERQPVARRLRVLHQESQFIRTPSGRKFKPFSDRGRM